MHEDELRELEQPCSYLDVQQKNDRGRGARGSAKARVKGKETPLTPLEQAERERKRLESEVGEWAVKTWMRACSALRHSLP